MKKLFTAGLLTVGLATAAPAAVVEFDFYVFDQSGLLLSDDGVLSYNDSLVPPTGATSLNPDDGIELSVTLFGTRYTGANDVDFPEFVGFDFFDGALAFIDYALIDGINGVDFSDQDFGSLNFAGDGLLFDEVDDIFIVTAFLGDIAPIPVPAGLPLMATGLIALGWMRRKSRQQS